MLRAALYARVSTEMQEKEQTIRSQLAAVVRHAEHQGFHTTTALTYTDEGYSGSYLDRPALDELRDHAREGRFDVVVVLCPDRLARKYAYQVLLMEELNRTGVEVHFCERPITDSPDDQLLLQIQGAIAEYERAKIAERSRRGRLHRARMGELSPGRLPYGYRRNAKRYGGDGKILIDEKEAAMVRQVFGWYAQEETSVYGVVRKLNSSEWKTRTGRDAWSSSTVLRMLRCEWYAGKAYYNRTKSTRNDGKTPRHTFTERPRAEWIEVGVPALIDEPLFQLVQRRIQENRHFAKRRLKYEGVYLLRGLLKCGVCGGAYVGSGKASPRNAGGNHIYHYYICGKRPDPFSDAVRGRCPNDRLRAAGVNEAVWTSIRDLLLDSDTFAQELAAWVERQTTMPSDQDVRTRKTEARLEELTRQRARLTDAYQTGALALDPFRTRIQALEANHAAAELALAEIKTKHLEVELVRSRALGAQQVISTLRTKLLDADFDTQQTILRLLVERVVVHGQSLEIHLALPVSGNSALTSKHLQEGDGAELGVWGRSGTGGAEGRADRAEEDPVISACPCHSEKSAPE
jgi:site-specific DNA recombinase